MPLITYDAPVQRISGRSTGNPNTYTFNNGAPVIRAQPRVTNPDTPDQQEIRAVFSTVTKNWKMLSQANRDAWLAWSQSHTVQNRLGNIVARNGISAYVQLATMHYVDTASLLSSAPVLSQPSPLTDITLPPGGQAGGNEIDFDVSHGYTTLTGLFLVTRATPGVGFQSQTPKLTDYRLVQGVDTSSIIALPTSGTTVHFAATTYAYANNDWVGVECTIMNAEGWQSSPFRVFQQYTT